MQHSKNDIWVGLFVLLGGAALVFLALQSANLLQLNFRSGYVITARFDNIGGLKVRAPVRSAGVVVGRVTSIRFDPKTYQGVVTLALDQRYTFPQDSAAKILTAGLLGDQYVGLEPGGDDTDLAPGANIAQTQSAVVLENLIGQLMTDKAAEVGSAPAPKK